MTFSKFLELSGAFSLSSKPALQLPTMIKCSLKISMFDFRSYFKNYEENAAYTRFAKTRINAQVSEIVKFTSKLAVVFFMNS